MGRLNDLLDDRETESDAFTVDCGGALQFSKAGEQLVHVLDGNSGTGVLNVHNQKAFLIVIACLYFDVAFLGELDRILHQVDQYLLQAALISIDMRKCFLCSHSKARWIFTFKGCTRSGENRER